MEGRGRAFEAQLEKVRLGAAVALAEEFLVDDVRVEQRFDVLRMYVRGHVWGEAESVRRQEVSYPADWWQAFKARWFPRWLLRRFPVRHRTVVLDVRAIYPEFRPALPDQEARLVITRREKEE